MNDIFACNVFIAEVCFTDTMNTRNKYDHFIFSLLESRISRKVMTKFFTCCKYFTQISIAAFLPYLLLKCGFISRNSDDPTPVVRASQPDVWCAVRSV
ncbi:hypothetical protein CPter291_1141 [Collimonas pratensis]|uniref:Uncharacterized protein n=1 Tax=Collimonas pratensis TaxID=279113 RepID=A0ABM5Z2Z2_9BURK|nr:hypothetical protein CPter291_1141 [Collimonas pratensis]